jgi:hypothetical protein
MSASPFLHPGRGKQLRGASSAGVVSDPEVLNIPNNGFSELFAGHDCLEFSLDIKINTGNATGDVLVEQGDDTSFTNVITQATIATNTKRLGSYKSGGPLTGYFRVKNTSGQTINVFLQKRIN